MRKKEKNTSFLKKSPDEKSNTPLFLQFSGQTLSHEKYPFTGHFGNTHAVIPTSVCVGGGGGGCTRPTSTHPVVEKLRPISLTDSFVNIFEGFVVEWILKALVSQLDKKQLENTTGVSTCHYLLDLLQTFNQHA